MSNTNYLSANRATLEIARTPLFSYSCTSYNIPEISVAEIEAPTRFNPGKEPDNRVDYGPLVVDFLVDEDLGNWKEIYDWIKSFAMPEGHFQYKGAKEAFSDATLTIYSSKNRPIGKVKFYEVWPKLLGDIQFQEDVTGVVVKKVTVTFSILGYDYIDTTKPETCS